MSESGAMLFSCCQTRDIFSLLFVQELGAEAKEIRVPGLKAGFLVRECVVFARR